MPAAALAALGWVCPQASRADGARAEPSLFHWSKARTEVSPRVRNRLTETVWVRFGGAALHRHTPDRVELRVAKEIIAAGLSMARPIGETVDAAWEGWRVALGIVPPAVAIHYHVLVLAGRRPRGRPIDLALSFPEHYHDEIAPELVAYWEAILREGQVADEVLLETRRALKATRVKMRPLLLDKLRLMAALDRQWAVAGDDRRAELRRDLDRLEVELSTAFGGVASRPEVLDKRRRAYDRLRIQLEDMGRSPSAEDRLLNPDAGPPPARPVPRPKAPLEQPPSPRNGGPPPVERDRSPPPVLPPQRRPGTPTPPEDPIRGRSPADLERAYRTVIVEAVDGWMGTPYRFGGDTRGVGTDCSGFMKVLFRDLFAVLLPRVSRDQYMVGRSVSRETLRAGDLVFFDIRGRGRVNHVGVYVSKGRFAHAGVSRGVTLARLESRYFGRVFVGARRILTYGN